MIVVKLFVISVPISVTADIITTAINAAMSAYSIAVAPLISCFRVSNSLCIDIGFPIFPLLTIFQRDTCSASLYIVRNVNHQGNFIFIYP